MGQKLLCGSALMQGQLKVFDSTMQYQEMGRLLCEFRLMDKAGGNLLALISSGAIVVLGFLLLLVSAAAVRSMSRKTAKADRK